MHVCTFLVSRLLDSDQKVTVNSDFFLSLKYTLQPQIHGKILTEAPFESPQTGCMQRMKKQRENGRVAWSLWCTMCYINAIIYPKPWALTVEFMYIKTTGTFCALTKTLWRHCSQSINMLCINTAHKQQQYSFTGNTIRNRKWAILHRSAGPRHGNAFSFHMFA